MQIKRVIAAEGKGGVAIQTDTINTTPSSISATSGGLTKYRRCR